MKSGGNNFNYFLENKLTKLANFVQFECMLTFCPENWGLGAFLDYATEKGNVSAVQISKRNAVDVFGKLWPRFWLPPLNFV